MDGHDGHDGGHASYDHGAGGHFGGGHGDLHGGHHGHHGHHGGDQHGGGHVTHEAIVLAYAHGSHDSHGFSMSHGVSHAQAHTHGTHANFGSQVSGQGIAGGDVDAMLQEANCGDGKQQGEPQEPEQSPQNTPAGQKPVVTDQTRTFLVHVMNHGHVEQMQRFYALARQFDLIRLDDRRPNFDTVNEVRYELSDWRAWAKPYNDGDMPDGFLPGFTGTTTFYRQYWQVGKRKHWWSKPEFDSKAMTFIEVSFVVWKYYETADYETKLTLRVVSFPAYDHTDGRWGYHKAAFERHQKAALRLANTIFEMLKVIPPSAESALLRQYYLSKLPEPPKPSPHSQEGASVADGQEEQDLRGSEILREKAHDASTRADAGQNAAPKDGDTPADNAGGEFAEGLTGTTHVGKPPANPQTMDHAGADLSNILVPPADHDVTPPPANTKTGTVKVSVEVPHED